MPANDARFWDRIARKYAANKLADPAGYERTLERVRHYLRPEQAVFEFGCGTGSTAIHLAPSVARYVAADISAEMLAITREKGEAAGVRNIETVQSTPDAASFPDASFDVAMGFNVLHLVEARPAALANVRRMLKPGGLFISKTPALKEVNPLIRLVVPLMRALGQAPYVAIFSTEELAREIAGAGFEIIERVALSSRKKDARPFLVARKA